MMQTSTITQHVRKALERGKKGTYCINTHIHSQEMEAQTHVSSLIGCAEWVHAHG